MYTDHCTLITFCHHCYKYSKTINFKISCRNFCETFCNLFIGTLNDGVLNGSEIIGERRIRLKISTYLLYVIIKRCADTFQNFTEEK